jgi:hypothetical protein
LQERVIVNTFCGLVASCVVTFSCSRRFRGGGFFDAVDIQNATLAGGVAMGTSCTLPLEPFGALILGGLAGALSCGGYVFVLDHLEKKGLPKFYCFSVFVFLIVHAENFRQLCLAGYCVHRRIYSPDV